MMTQMLMARTPSSSNVATGQSWESSRVGNVGSYQLNTDGSYTKLGTGTASDWYSPVTGGIGTSYWVQADITSGPALSSGTVGSRLQLSSNRKWESQLEAVTALELNIYDASSGGNLLGTNTLTLTSTPA